MMNLFYRVDLNIIQNFVNNLLTKYDILKSMWLHNNKIGQSKKSYVLKCYVQSLSFDYIDDLTGNHTCVNNKCEFWFTVFSTNQYFSNKNAQLAYMGLFGNELQVINVPQIKI